MVAQGSILAQQPSFPVAAVRFVSRFEQNGALSLCRGAQNRESSECLIHPHFMGHCRLLCSLIVSFLLIYYFMNLAVSSLLDEYNHSEDKGQLGERNRGRKGFELHIQNHGPLSLLEPAIIRPLIQPQDFKIEEFGATEIAMSRT